MAPAREIETLFLRCCSDESRRTRHLLSAKGQQVDNSKKNKKIWENFLTSFESLLCKQLRNICRRALSLTTTTVHRSSPFCSFVFLCVCRPCAGWHWIARHWLYLYCSTAPVWGLRVVAGEIKSDTSIYMGRPLPLLCPGRTAMLVKYSDMVSIQSNVGGPSFLSNQAQHDWIGPIGQRGFLFLFSYRVSLLVGRLVPGESHTSK